MTVKPLPSHVDTLIVGNGPSALILSFILNGNIPYYNPANPHPDAILHNKLSKSPCLLDVNVHDLTTHFAASRLSYSTQALPINVLLDTLIRPLADIDPEQYQSCLEWRYEAQRKVPHLVLGNTAQVGGQWADNPISASWDIGTLSYAEMLSLPGYSFEEYFKGMTGGSVPDFHRPTRREVAGYLATYSKEVGIQDSVFTDVEVGDIRRINNGFHVASHNITCNHLVLASGIFSKLIPPRPSLRLLSTLPKPNASSNAPLLVVGSGFTAADVIISTPPNRKIIHIFKWDPEDRPSPLRACHPRAYPEYASVYRRMRRAAKHLSGSSNDYNHLKRRNSNFILMEHFWDNVYEGLPNTYIRDVAVHGDTALLSLETEDGKILEREISGVEYVIGRRGSLNYLDDKLAVEVLGTLDQRMDSISAVSGRTLRSRAEKSLEITSDVFLVGSLTGDSLIRFAYGGCIFAAREIMRHTETTAVDVVTAVESPSGTLVVANRSLADESESRHYEAVSFDGQPDPPMDKVTRSISTDRKTPTCKPWKESSCWRVAAP